MTINFLYMPPIQQPFYQQLSFKLLSLTLICLAIFVAQDIIVPIAFSVLLSILLLPITNFLERKKVSRVLANFIAIIIAFLVISGLIYFLSSQISNFVQDLPSIKKHLSDHWKTIQDWIYQKFHLSQSEQKEIVDSAAIKIKNSGTGILGDTFLNVTQALLVITLLPIYTFLLLYYRDMIKSFFIRIFKNEHEPKVIEVLRESRLIVQGYMIGLMIEMGIVATINSLGFLVLGIQYAIFLGVLAAILNMIPYIGMLIASIFCMLITLTNSTQIGDIFGVIAILVFVQFIDNNIIMPKVVSSKVKINALITILGVLIGGALAGISGMFLSIPSIAILKVIFDRIDDMKPWGMLLGDDITGSKKSKFYLKLNWLNNKFRPPTPVKPPTI